MVPIEEEQHLIYLAGLCHVNHFLHHIICILVLRKSTKWLKSLVWLKRSKPSSWCGVVMLDCHCSLCTPKQGVKKFQVDTKSPNWGHSSTSTFNNRSFSAWQQYAKYLINKNSLLHLGGVLNALLNHVAGELVLGQVENFASYTVHWKEKH